MKKQISQTLLGMALGLLGNIIGFLIYGFVYSWMNNVAFSWFYQNVFIGMESFRSQILTGSLLVNVVLFYFLMKSNKETLSKGMMVTILLTVIAINYYFT